MKPMLFDSREFGTVRVVEHEGSPLFVAKDVAEALGYTRPRDAVSDHCKGGVVLALPTAGGEQGLTCIPEADVYRLIFRSKLPSASRFQDWVMEEVLPAIRKTGTYGVAIPQTLPEALRLAADLAEKNEALALEVETMKPKAEFHDAVTASDDLVTMATAAQLIGLPFGGNTLFQRLRNRGVLITGGARHNLPKQEHVTNGRFTVKESSFLRDGETHVRFTTYVTQKGLDWLRREFQPRALQTA